MNLWSFAWVQYAIGNPTEGGPDVERQYQLAGGARVRLS